MILRSNIPVLTTVIHGEIGHEGKRSLLITSVMGVIVASINSAIDPPLFPHSIDRVTASKIGMQSSDNLAVLRC